MITPSIVCWNLAWITRPLWEVRSGHQTRYLAFFKRGSCGYMCACQRHPKITLYLIHTLPNRVQQIVVTVTVGCATQCGSITHCRSLCSSMSTQVSEMAPGTGLWRIHPWCTSCLGGVLQGDSHICRTPAGDLSCNKKKMDWWDQSWRWQDRAVLATRRCSIGCVLR